MSLARTLLALVLFTYMGSANAMASAETQKSVTNIMTVFQLMRSAVTEVFDQMEQGRAVSHSFVNELTSRGRANLGYYLKQQGLLPSEMMGPELASVLDGQGNMLSAHAVLSPLALKRENVSYIISLSEHDQRLTKNHCTGILRQLTSAQGQSGLIQVKLTAWTATKFCRTNGGSITADLVANGCPGHPMMFDNVIREEHTYSQFPIYDTACGDTNTLYFTFR